MDEKKKPEKNGQPVGEKLLRILEFQSMILMKKSGRVKIMMKNMIFII